jgi:hypothetical protein
MTEIGEAMGTAAEGALAGRVFAGPREESEGLDKGRFHERACLNCGTELIGPHCHACGQKAHLHRTLGALGHDIAHGALHLDGKTWRTLPLLVARPGELTRRYIAGERAKFVSPMALFLFSIFLMFAVFQAVGLSAPTEIPTREGLARNVVSMRANLVEDQQALRGRIAKLPPGDPRRAALEGELAELTQAVAALDEAKNVTQVTNGVVTVRTLNTGWRWFDKALDKWRENPGLMLYKLQTNSYKFSWLLIPLSLPFMWLLFAWKRGVRVYDHAIFVTYSIAFMSLLFVVASLLGVWGVPSGVIVPLVTLLPAWHLYRQLRGAYGLSRFSALWRLAVLIVMIAIVIMLFLQILFVLGAF